MFVIYEVRNPGTEFFVGVVVLISIREGLSEMFPQISDLGKIFTFLKKGKFFGGHVDFS